MKHIMRQIRVGKLTLNMGVGEPGDKLNKAFKLLEIISGEKPVRTKTERRIPTWGIRPGLQIGCKVTLRGAKAEKVLNMLLKSVENKIPESKFDAYGNLSFGIKEYIDIPGIEYRPEIGILGLEAAITLERPGFRVKSKLKSAKLGKKHKITKQDAMEFMQEKFQVQVIEA
ncbi:MAG TPA: 50S ribosomal protein L5 [Candidatus Nanoarchaeia archaeon]|nr:50S ribosomal protein L5 [Candidatus Nanoarchaeia archaeon]